MRLNDIAERHGRQRHASAVGEVNVVDTMKAVGAPIGGEGNGGVILERTALRPRCAGRYRPLPDAAGQAREAAVRSCARSYPDYFISKNKIELKPGMDVQALVDDMQETVPRQPHSTVDGLRIEFGNTWVHLRKSNTEPIIRVYAEAPSMAGGRCPGR